MQAGLDSLGAVELRNSLAEHLAISLPVTATFDHPTIAAMSSYISGLRAKSGIGIVLPQPADRQPATRKEDVQNGVAMIVKDMLGLAITLDQVPSPCPLCQG